MNEIEAFLDSRGAAEIAHPGGTLLDHLLRVEALLDGWGAAEALRRAGLCHAVYGTSGFDHAMLSLEERATLKTLIGDDAEAIVYLYGSCDRELVFPRLGEDNPTFVDRFTGAKRQPAPAVVAAFVELTAANELDVVRHNPQLRAEHGDDLAALFRTAEAWLSGPAKAAWSSS